MAEDDYKEQLPEPATIYLVDCEVISGSNLVIRDRNSSDPYVNVFCGNRKFQTITIDQNLNPTWDAKVTFYFTERPNEIQFVVKDRDRGRKPDPMGNATLSLQGFFDGPGAKTFNNSLKLQDVEHGDINVAVSCRAVNIPELYKKQKYLIEDTNKIKEEIKKQTNERNNVLPEKNKELENEIQQLRQQLESNEDLKTAERNLLSAQEEGRQLMEQLAQPKKENEELKKGLEELKQTKIDLEEKLRTLSNELNSLNDDNYNNLEQQSSADADKSNEHIIEASIISHCNRLHTLHNGTPVDPNDNSWTEQKIFDAIFNRIKGIGEKIEEKKYALSQLARDSAETEVNDDIKEKQTVIQQENDKAVNDLNSMKQSLKQWKNSFNLRIRDTSSKQKNNQYFRHYDDQRKSYYDEIFCRCSNIFFNIYCLHSMFQNGTLTLRYPNDKNDGNNDYDNNNEEKDDEKASSNNNSPSPLTKSEYEKLTGAELEKFFTALFPDISVMLEEIKKWCPKSFQSGSMQKLCKRTTEFFNDYYKGNYLIFIKNVCHSIVKEIDEDLQQSYANKTEEFITKSCDFILELVNDKFLSKLKDSFPLDDDNNNYNEEQKEVDQIKGQPSQDSYEYLVGCIVLYPPSLPVGNNNNNNNATNSNAKNEEGQESEEKQPNEEQSPNEESNLVTPANDSNEQNKMDNLKKILKLITENISQNVEEIKVCVQDYYDNYGKDSDVTCLGCEGGIGAWFANLFNCSSW